MKRIVDNKYYIQKMDVYFYLFNDIKQPPASVLDKFFEGADSFTLEGSTTDIELETPEEIEYYNSLDYTFDYDEVSKRSIDDLENDINDMTIRINEITTAIRKGHLERDGIATLDFEKILLEYHRESLKRYIDSRKRSESNNENDRGNVRKS